MKPLKPLLPIFVSPMLALAACADETTADPADTLEQGFFNLVAFAPMGDLESVTDACFSVEILNGATPAKRILARGSAQNLPAAGTGGDGGPTWAEGESGSNGRLADPLCITAFGGNGAITYVAPCDAEPGATEHTVRIWVNAVCASGTVDGGDCTPPDNLVNPCGADGCVQTVTCMEGADVPVSFDFNAR